MEISDGELKIIWDSLAEVPSNQLFWEMLVYQYQIADLLHFRERVAEIDHKIQEIVRCLAAQRCYPDLWKPTDKMKTLQATLVKVLTDVRRVRQFVRNHRLYDRTPQLQELEEWCTEYVVTILNNLKASPFGQTGQSEVASA